MKEELQILPNYSDKIRVYQSVDKMENKTGYEDYCLYAIEIKSSNDVLYKIGLSMERKKRLTMIRNELKRERRQLVEPKYSTGKAVICDLDLTSSLGNYCENKNVRSIHRLIANNRETWVHHFLHEKKASWFDIYPQQFLGNSEMFRCSEEEVCNAFSMMIKAFPSPKHDWGLHIHCIKK